MNDPEQLFDRCDVAALLGVSPDFVRRNEQRLGLEGARVVIRRKVHFRRGAVERLAIRLGIKPQD